MHGRLPSIGPFAFDDTGTFLTRDGVPVALGQRAVRLLAALAGAQGRVVLKDELMKAGWGHQAVEDSNLTVQIAAVRKVLGRRPDGEEWIATINRVGYRLANGPVPAVTTEPDADGMLRCAVLPFSSDSRDEDQVLFAQGLADDLITDLSRLPDLRVTTRASAFRYGDGPVPMATIARDLGVRYVVQGSVRRDADRLRVNVHVIDARHNTHVWGGRFDGDMTTLFPLQDRISAELVAGLTSVVRPHLSQRSRPSNADANEAFLQGRALVSQWSGENIEGRKLLLMALDRDPSFARAHAWLSQSHHFSWLFDYGSDGDDRQKATAHARRAIVLDGNEPDACWSFGLDLAYSGDLDGALRHLRRALELNPSLADAWVFMGDVLALNGQPEAAIDCVRNALVLNPFAPPLYRWHQGFNQYSARRYEDAETTLRDASVTRDGPKRMLAATLARLGRHDEAKAVARDFLRTHPAFSIRQWAARHPFRHDADREHFVEGYLMAGLPD